MDSWREINVIWQEKEGFVGYNKEGKNLILGAPDGFSPMELLLVSLAGCTGMDVVSILQKKRQPIHSLKIVTRGLRREEQPRIYTEIDVLYQFGGENLDPKAIEQAIALSQQKYCSVSAMLGQSSVLRTSYTILTEQNVTQG